MRARVTSTGARKLRTVCRQNDAAVGVPPRSPPNRNDDTREVPQVCQTNGTSLRRRVPLTLTTATQFPRKATASAMRLVLKLVPFVCQTNGT